MWDLATALVKLLNVLLLEKQVVAFFDKKILPETVQFLLKKAIDTNNTMCANACILNFGYFTANLLTTQRLINKDHVKILINLVVSTKDNIVKRHIRALLFDFSKCVNAMGAVLT